MRDLSFLGARRRLAADLQRLRQDAGLTTYELAQRLEMSQSKVSKIENARVGVSAQDAESWARVAGMSEEATAELGQRAEAALTEALGRRALAQVGLAARQREVASLEQEATAIRVFYPDTLHGLLQTPAYAHRVFLQWYPESSDVAAAVVARLDRQTVLFDQDKQFEFVIPELAMRWMPVSGALGLAQLDRLRTLATLPNVSLQVVPLAQRDWVWHAHGFVLYEGLQEGVGLVSVETLTVHINVSDAPDVDAYRTVFDLLRVAAIQGDEVLAFLDRLMSEGMSSIPVGGGI